ncbi:MAG: SirB1 family protein [Anaerolineae bacterium]
MSLSRFHQLINQDHPPLLEASLLLVKNIVDSTLDIEQWTAAIDDLAADASEHVSVADDVATQALDLADWLFGTAGAGFQGNRRHYGDPRNSFINQVVERKLGIPITLSIILIETAARLEIPLVGIGLPGHFVVGSQQVEVDGWPLLIDPFNHGKQLKRDDCAQLIAQTSGFQGQFQEEWLQPTSSKYILIRVLNNLRIAFMRQEDWASAILSFKHLQILDPEQASHYRDEGLVHYHIKQYLQASTLLEKYSELEPEAKDIDMIKSMVSEQLTKWAKLN